MVNSYQFIDHWDMVHKYEFRFYFFNVLIGMGWLRKLFTKDKKMSLKEKSYEEIVEFLQDKDFQWLKGEQMGNIEKYNLQSGQFRGAFKGFYFIYKLKVIRKL